MICNGIRKNILHGRAFAIALQASCRKKPLICNGIAKIFPAALAGAVQKNSPSKNNVRWHCKKTPNSFWICDGIEKQLPQTSLDLQRHCKSTPNESWNCKGIAKKHPKKTSFAIALQKHSQCCWIWNNIAKKLPHANQDLQWHCKNNLVGSLFCNGVAKKLSMAILICNGITKTLPFLILQWCCEKAIPNNLHLQWHCKNCLNASWARNSITKKLPKANLDL